MTALRLLDPHQLVPNDSNPRADLDVADLAASIRNVGLLQALLVVPIEPDTTTAAADDEACPPRFRIIAGHRRHAAALQVGLQEVPCLIAADDGQASELVKILNENDLRTDLTNASRCCSAVGSAPAGPPPRPGPGSRRRSIGTATWSP